MDTNKAKQELRNKIAEAKSKYSEQDFVLQSDEVFSVLEITGFFQQAKTILIYNNLKDEVHTKAFINKWKSEKNFYLPVVSGEGLVFRKYTDNTQFQTSSLGIQEPLGENLGTNARIDLIIVPGMAFDRKLNRLGRGKGYYDRFLSSVKATKVGVCYEFQLVDNLPFDDKDVKMDIVVSENDIIWS